MNYTFDFSPVLAAWPMLMSGALQTLKLSALSMAFGMIFGIVIMLMRKSGLRAFRYAAVGYIELIRNTPFLVQIFFFFFGMPSLGIRLDAEQAAILAMTINCAAYTAEILRGGVESIRPGQIEAGKALGLHRIDIYRFVILKPAIRAVYPALCSQFILMTLNSSLVASISAEELTYMAQVIDARTFRSFEVYFIIGIVYFIISQAFSLFFQSIGKYYISYPTK
jgi:polar amino acid transport system permease protein